MKSTPPITGIARARLRFIKKFTSAVVFFALSFSVFIHLALADNGGVVKSIFNLAARAGLIAIVASLVYYNFCGIKFYDPNHEAVLVLKGRGRYRPPKVFRYQTNEIVDSESLYIEDAVTPKIRRCGVIMVAVLIAAIANGIIAFIVS